MATRKMVAEAGLRRILAAMRVLSLLLFLAVLLAGAPLRGAARVEIPSMRTSIYVGTVTLDTSTLARDGETYTATYEARVWPWFFCNETGRMVITVPDADLARLSAGEMIEFTGEAFNHKNKPRRVTGRAQPAGPGRGEGRIKVRIGVDDIELIFNGDYRFEDAPAR